jgi:hypothetical protein
MVFRNPVSCVGYAMKDESKFKRKDRLSKSALPTAEQEVPLFRAEGFTHSFNFFTLL